MDNLIKLRVHHFYDIIRDFGSGKKVEPHPFGHSYHKIVKLIHSKSNLKIKIVIGNDSVCDGCIHCKNDHCDDVITHRKDFTSKEKFNNYIDKKIMGMCQIEEGDILTPVQLCQSAKCYLDNISNIYLGNDERHTKERKKNVIKGLNYYSQLHEFKLNL